MCCLHKVYHTDSKDFLLPLYLLPFCIIHNSGVMLKDINKSVDLVDVIMYVLILYMQTIMATGLT